MSEAKTDNGTRSNLQQVRQWMTERLARTDRRARSLLTEHPFVSLACAVGAGFLASRLLSWRGTRSDR